VWEAVKNGRWVAVRGCTALKRCVNENGATGYEFLILGVFAPLRDTFGSSPDDLRKTLGAAGKVLVAGSSRTRKVTLMKATSPVMEPDMQAFPGCETPDHSTPKPFAPRGPIRFRFVLKFAPQMSTPCSRGVAINPRAGRVLARRAPRLFQSYLQRHSVLQ
jgi:hypothetical protein